MALENNVHKLKQILEKVKGQGGWTETLIRFSGLENSGKQESIDKCYEDSAMGLISIMLCVSCSGTKSLNHLDLISKIIAWNILPHRHSLMSWMTRSCQKTPLE